MIKKSGSFISLNVERIMQEILCQRRSCSTISHELLGAFHFICTTSKPHQRDEVWYRFKKVQVLKTEVLLCNWLGPNSPHHSPGSFWFLFSHFPKICFLSPLDHLKIKTFFYFDTSVRESLEEIMASRGVIHSIYMQGLLVKKNGGI